MVRHNIIYKYLNNGLYMANRISTNITKSIKSNSYWSRITELKERYYGVQDEYLKKNYPPNNPNQLMYVETVTIEPLGMIGNGRRCAFKLPELEPSDFVYRNLRINSNNLNMNPNLFDDAIGSCQLECNNSIIDNIYGRTFKTLRYIYDIDDTTLVPFYFSRENEYLPNNYSSKINISFLRDIPNDVNIQDFSLSIDIYKICDPNFNPSIPYINAVPTCQFTGEESAHFRASKYRLSYNHVVDFILVSIPDNTLSHINLRFIDSSHPSIDINIPIGEMIYYDNHYIIPLTMSLNSEHINVYGINFSRCDSIQLDTMCINNGNIDSRAYIYGITCTPIKSQNKDIILLFSS